MVVTLALAARLLFIWHTRDAPGLRAVAPGLDMDLNWRGADHLLARRETSFELAALSAPFFPCLLAGWKLLFGDAWLAFRVFMALQGTVRVALMFGLCRRWKLAPLASALACLLVALVPSMVFFDTVPMKVGIELTLLVALLWVTTLAFEHAKRRLGWGILAGLLLSALFLSQLNTFLYVVPVLAFACLDRPARVAPRLRFAVGVAVVALPVLVGFASRGPDATRFVSRAGVDMWIGWNPSAGGVYRAARDVPGNPFGHAFTARVALEARLGRPVTAPEAERMYRQRAVDYVREHPLEALRLGVRKIALFFNDEEITNETSLRELRRASPLARWPIGFGCVVVAAALGVVALLRAGERQRLVLLLGLVCAQLVANVLTFVSWRFRLPAVVPLGLLAGYGLDHVFGIVSRKEWRDLVRPAIVSALAAAVAFLPLLRDERDGFAAIGRANQIVAQQGEHWRGQLAAGATGLERAMLLHELHRYSEAFEELERHGGALHENPAAATAYLEYLVARGEYARAKGLLADLDRSPAHGAATVLLAANEHVRGAMQSVAGWPASTEALGVLDAAPLRSTRSPFPSSR